MNKSKETTNYVVQRIIGGAVTIAITVICGRITILHHRKERQEDACDKHREHIAEVAGNGHLKILGHVRERGGKILLPDDLTTYG